MLKKRAAAAKASKESGAVAGLVDRYQSMNNPRYRRLAQSTRRDYDKYLKAIRTKFGAMRIVGLNAPVMRKHFKEWRDELSDRPRAADMRMIVLDWLLKAALDDRLIEVNHAEGVERLYRGPDDVKIWSPADIAVMEANAPPHIWRVIRLGLLTGARLSALLALSPRNLDGNWLEYDPRKRGNLVRMALDEYPELADAIEELPKDGLRLLLNSRNRPWTVDGFETSFRTCRLKIRDAGLQAGHDVTFHGLRRTAITNWFDRISPEKIALLTGHSLAYVTDIIDRYYVKRSRENARGALRALNASATKGTTKRTTQSNIRPLNRR